jgi:alanine-glyoxylate transaminase/serine-glyoxylate transaminase/serine-pyruvate transaminase
MVASNLIEPGESALIVNTGYFGDRFADCLTTYGAKVTHLNAPGVGQVPTLDVRIAGISLILEGFHD